VIFEKANHQGALLENCESSKTADFLAYKNASLKNRRRIEVTSTAYGSLTNLFI